jgi:hypothetical protein
LAGIHDLFGRRLLGRVNCGYRERHEKFLFDRFRPEMKKAVDAWLKTDPFNKPTPTTAT